MHKYFLEEEASILYDAKGGRVRERESGKKSKLERDREREKERGGCFPVSPQYE